MQRYSLTLSDHSESLLDEVWPGVPRRPPLQPNESLISIGKALRVQGYRPE